MKVLFVTSNRVGDAVLSTAALGHILDCHPDAKVTVACGAAPASLFAALPNLERLIVVTKRRHSRHWLSLWADCVGSRWDLVCDMRGSALAWVLLAKERRVLRPNRGKLTRQGVPLPHRLVELGALFGLAPPPEPRVWIGALEDQAAAGLIPKGGPVLALGPTANWLPKTWAAANFVELAHRLTAPSGKLAGARIAILASGGERDLARPVIAALPEGRVIDLVGKVDLAIAAACLRRCALYVGNDSGLMHLAAASGVPTLGLFGPSPANEYAPWGRRTGFVQTAIPHAEIFPPNFDPRVPCSLMDSLSVDMAEQGALELLARCEGG